MSRGRLEAFSDGVFAVAITLLAFNLAVAGPGHGPLLHQLTDRWPAFLAYLISFFTIGIIWVNHHAVVDNIALVNRTLLFLNLLLLLFVVAIPFGTATMATYLTESGQDANVAMVVYVITLLGMGLSFGGIFAWSLGAGRTHRPIPAGARRAVTFRFTIGSVLYVMALVIAFVSPAIALAIVGLVAVYYISEGTVPGRKAPM
jgi:TMEM175 potassium channel family protein